MYKATVVLPVTGLIYLNVESDKELEANQWINKALEENEMINIKDIQELQLVTKVCGDNICYAPINSAFVDKVKRDATDF